ncbi:MAG: HU family DNA-binding protein, partial [Prevotella sp.]|nr:HU family DNA-binding protein [Prevotella sp.]
MPTLKDIAKILVQKHELKQRDADLFVSAFVETILEGLRNDRQVKIKGFGTFKVTAVRDRESVNINTGERVVISGHDKISFTPDAVMRDIVNKPFAQFETVVLADDVNFDDMPLGENLNSDMDEIDKVIDANDTFASETKAENAVNDKSSELSRFDETMKVTNMPEVEKVKSESDETETIVEGDSLEDKNEVDDKQKTVSSISANSHKTNSIVEISEKASDINTVPEEVSQSVQTVRDDAIVNDNLSNSQKENDVIAKSAVVKPIAESSASHEQEKEEPEQEDENKHSVDEVPKDSDNDCKKVFLLYAIVVNILVAGIAFVIGYLCATNNWLGLNINQTNDIVQPAEYVENGTINDKNTTANTLDSVQRNEDNRNVEVKNIETNSVSSPSMPPAESVTNKKDEEGKENPLHSEKYSSNEKY